MSSTAEIRKQTTTEVTEDQPVRTKTTETIETEEKPKKKEEEITTTTTVETD
jgi:hypothetical protein